MEKAKRRVRLGAEGWRAAVKRFDESGLSARAFCEREELGVASLYQWRTRLAAQPDREAAAEKTRRAKPAAAGFLDLGTLSAKSARLELRLDLGSGVVVHLVRG